MDENEQCEITPEMVEAGVEAVCECGLGDHPEDVARKVYLAMHYARADASLSSV